MKPAVSPFETAWTSGRAGRTPGRSCNPLLRVGALTMQSRLPATRRAGDRAVAPFPQQRPAIQHWGGKAAEIRYFPDGSRRLSVPDCMHNQRRRSGGGNDRLRRDR
jgi:hypothetical protein